MIFNGTKVNTKFSNQMSYIFIDYIICREADDDAVSLRVII